MKPLKKQKSCPEILTHELFEKHINFIYEELLLADLPSGFLNLLVEFLERIQLYPPAAKVYRELLVGMSQEDEDLYAHKKQLIDWMLLKLESLKAMKPYCLSRHVKKIVDETENFLIGKQYEIILFGGSYLQKLQCHFEAACRSIAAFGSQEMQSDWLVQKKVSVCCRFEKKAFFSVKGKMKLDAFSKKGEVLAEKIGHGYVSALVYKNPNHRGAVTCEIKYDKVDHIRFPKESIKAVRRSEDLLHFKSAKDCMPGSNLRYLLLFSRYCDLNPVPTSELPRPKTVFEAEELNNGQVLQYFLSGFSKENWKDVPVAKEEILKSVKRFILFIKEAILIDEAILFRGPRALTQEARKFVKGILERILLPLPASSRNEYTYDQFRPLVWKEAKNSGVNGLLQACSMTLIEKECKAFAKKHKWRPKRGKAAKKE